MEWLPMLGCLAFIVGLLAALPRAQQWLRQHLNRAPQVERERVQVLCAAAVGPQQRIVTVQVHDSTLVLGVTAHNISCLHVVPAHHEQASSHG